MSETRWTAGPWTAGWNGTCWQIDARMDAIATTQFCYAPETEANAHLIAAAPKLAEACRIALLHAPSIRLAPERRKTIEVLEAALAKAKGEG